MRIAFISQWFDPETGSAAIPGSIARALSDRGHEVTVITGFPNYPIGTLYPGYRMRLLQRETRGPLAVLRVPMYPAHGSSGLKRAAFFLSFMLSASTWGAWLVRRNDVVLVYSTSATVGLAGVVMKRVFRKPVVLYVEDLWPDSVLASGMVRGPAARVAWSSLSRLASWGYQAATRIAVISPGMQRILGERGVPAGKFDLVYNWVDEEVFSPRPARTASNRFEVMYAGNLGDVQGLHTAIRAVACLADRPEIHLRLVGGGVAEPSLRLLARDIGVDDRVHFDGVRPLSEMADVLAEAQVQLVCLRDLPMFTATMPSKTQAILACGRPAVVSAPGDVAALVEKAGAGRAVKPEDPEALAAAIRELADMQPTELEELGRSGRRFYERELCASVGAARLEEALTRSIMEES